MNGILLTGSSGFFGHHLALAFGPDCLTPARQELDLLDDEATRSYLERHRPRAVVHAAGFVGGIELNRAHPGRMASENLRMGLNLLEAASRVDGVHVVIISTVCVYPENAPIPTSENEIWSGYPAPETAPYGLAKRELLSLVQALHDEYGLPFSYLIPTNLYGPGDHFEPEKSHVVPALIKRFREAALHGVRVVEAWGDGTATRDLLFVDDAARAVADVVRLGPFPEPINLASGREVPMRELAETIAEAASYRGEIHWDPSKPSGAPRRALDGTRAEALFGFRPQVSLTEGLRRTIDWYVDTVEGHLS